MSSQPEPVREPVMNTKTYYTTPPVIDVSTSGPTIEIPENRILGNTNLPDEAQPGLEGTSRRPGKEVALEEPSGVGGGVPLDGIRRFRDV
jgi:hypothetical protein